MCGKKTIRAGVVGYGNLGKGVEAAMRYSEDMKLIAIFTCRVNAVKNETDSFVESIEAICHYKGEIDVLVLCGGHVDLERQLPIIAPNFNFVDSYDNHAKIPQYFADANVLLKKGGNTGIIASGWDPGLFSVQRLVGRAVLPDCKQYTLWGSGVSQGHSEAVRRIQGVKFAIQYTIPKPGAIEKIRGLNTFKPSMQNKKLTKDIDIRQIDSEKNIGKKYNLDTPQGLHERHCYIVPHDYCNAGDLERIKDSVLNMPDYFKGYETKVNFISGEEFAKHTTMPHGGYVFTAGITADGSNHIIEYSLKLDSNPSFTAGVLVAYARAAIKLNSTGQHGAKTVFDVPPSYLINFHDENSLWELL